MLIICDSRRLRDKYIARVGWRGLANVSLHVWDGRPYALDFATSAVYDRVRAIGTDPDLLCYAQEYAEFLGAEYGAYPRVASVDKDDRPANYSGGDLEEGASGPRTLRDVLSAAANAKREIPPEP